MRITFQVGADPRHDQGKGASRRLRRAGKVPAVLYGGEGEPRNITLDHQQLLTLIDNEKFYSSIISVNVDAQAQPAIVRDVQMHPARNAVVHVDLQRVLENEKLKIHLPIHFKGEAVAPGVKTQGGIVSHLMQDVEVSCLPKDLPEFLELDLSAMNLNDTLSSVGYPAARGRHDSGAGASQSGGGVGAQPARCRARAGGGCAATAEGAAAAPAAAAAAAAGRLRRPARRKSRRRKRARRKPRPRRKEEEVASGALDLVRETAHSWRASPAIASFFVCDLR